MANVFTNFLDYLKLGEDDLDDPYEDYDNEFETGAKPSRTSRITKAEKDYYEEQPVIERATKKTARKQYADNRYEDYEVIEPRKERLARMERERLDNKIVPIKKMVKGFEVCIMKPLSFTDSQEICDMILTGRATVVNLEGFDSLEAQRIMDFVSGAIYAVNGKLHQISKYIFIFSPENVDISGDYADLVPEEGFEVPTLHNDF